MVTLNVVNLTVLEIGMLKELVFLVALKKSKSV